MRSLRAEHNGHEVLPTFYDYQFNVAIVHTMFTIDSSSSSSSTSGGSSSSSNSSSNSSGSNRKTY